MVKSKIFLKTILILGLFIFLYNLVISLIILPKVDKKIIQLEEQSAKIALNKVALIVENVHKDLESFKKTALEQHKNELKSLTSTSWSLIKTKYEQSKPENINILLKEHGERFKKKPPEFL